jgi:TubC N-terminal docking domain
MSNTLLAELRSAGVELSIDPNGRLAFDAPASVMTDELLARIRLNRDALLRALQPSHPEPEMWMGLGCVCPYCRDIGFVEDGSVSRCSSCGRIAWRTLPDGSVIRADYVERRLVDWPRRKDSEEPAKKRGSNTDFRNSFQHVMAFDA